MTDPIYIAYMYIDNPCSPHQGSRHKAANELFRLKLPVYRHIILSHLADFLRLTDCFYKALWPCEKILVTSNPFDEIFYYPMN